MKVWIPDIAAESSGGLYRVLSGLHKYLPEYGIEITSKENADIINYHIGMFDNNVLDKPTVVSSHGLLWKEHGWGRLAVKTNKECLAAYRIADTVTTPSNFVARAISRHTLADVKVVHHGIDTAKWLPAKSKGYILWNKARVDPANDPSIVNELANLAPDLEFYTTFGKESDNVFIFGVISPSEMYDVVSQAGVYLDTPLESGGPCFGVLEAMACGVPVLAWNSGGNAESVIHKETGYLAKNTQDMLEGLHYCIEHRERLGTNARQLVVEKYQWSHSVEKYIDAYRYAQQYYKNETVSVIVPCYNLGQFLPHCLGSLQEQTYSDLEILVIDDASQDNTKQIIKEYANKDSRIRGIFNPVNMHVSESRNEGIWSAGGKYILPLDADDRLFPDAIENMVNALKDKKLDIVAGKLKIYHESDLEGDSIDSGWPNNTELALQVEGHNRLPYCSMYRPKVWERVGGYRRRIRSGVEDADFWTRALSWGYKSKILDEYTLKYTHREQSLGKVNQKGNSVWLDWFSWKNNSLIAPANLTEIPSYCEPKVSIVVPVGPGHVHHLQTCIDSLLAQTETEWEVIVINDTGDSWFSGNECISEYLLGMGFVRFIDNDTNRGVAWSRNRGVEAALSERIIFLDVDDIAQPNMIESLLAAQEYAGGWIYGDWYINSEYSAAKDWDLNLIKRQSLSPITGLYQKNHIVSVGGFDENAPGWEDWDLHLKLVSTGICGTRLAVPLITYNMHLGDRREENFSNKENLLKYILDKHRKFIRGNEMGCGSCGGKNTLSVKSKASKVNNLGEMVEMRYLGPMKQSRTFNSPSRKGRRYQISGNKSFYVFEDDVPHFMKFKTRDNENMYEIVEKVVTPTIELVENPPLVSDTPKEINRTPLENIGLEKRLVNILHGNGIATAEKLDFVDDAELLSYKGIGNKALETINKALELWNS